MKILIYISFLLITQSVHSQQSTETDEILSFITKQIARNNLNPHTNILLINNLPYDQEIDISFFQELSMDTLPDYSKNLLYTQHRENREGIERVMNDSDMKKTIENLYNKFDQKHKTSKGQIEVEKLTIVEASAKCFRRIHKSKRKDPYKKMANKYGTTTAIAFSQIERYKNYATLYYEYYCGKLCGAGNLLIMEQINGKWESVTEINMWIS